MKKILFIVIFLISCAALSAQTGTGWTNMRAKYNFRDSVNINNGWKIGATIVAPSVTEINYVDGVTSAIQTQLNSVAGRIQDSIQRNALFTHDYYITEVAGTVYAIPHPKTGYVAYQGATLDIPLQKAIDASDGGKYSKRIYIAEGLYDNCESISITHDTITIEGAGMFKTIIKVKDNWDAAEPTDTYGFLSNIGKHYFTMRNLQIDGNGATMTYKDNNESSDGIVGREHGVGITTVGTIPIRPLIENCYIHDFAGSAGIWMNATDPIVRNNLLIDNYSNQITLNQYTTDAVVYGNYCKGGGDVGISIYGNYNRVYDNVVEDVNGTQGTEGSQWGITVEGNDLHYGDYNTISNNLIKGDMIAGISMSNDASAISHIGNVFENNQIILNKTANIGIIAVEDSLSVYKGNFIKLSGSGDNCYGIKTYGTERSIFEGNTVVQAAGTAALKVSYDGAVYSLNNTFKNNHFYNASYYAVQIDANCDYNRFINNTLSGASVDVLQSGTATSNTLWQDNYGNYANGWLANTGNNRTVNYTGDAASVDFEAADLTTTGAVTAGAITATSISTSVLQVGDATSNTKAIIDSMAYVGSELADYDGADTIMRYVPYANREEGISLADSVNYPNGYMSRFDGVTGLAGKASTTLNNLGTTAINANLIPDGDGTRNLGSPAANAWNDAFFDTGSIINWDNGDLLQTHSENTLTQTGGQLAVQYAKAGDGAIWGYNSSGTSNSRGVVGQAQAASGTGNYMGVYGYANGANTGTNIGVYGTASAATINYAGYFSGNVYMSGALLYSSKQDTISGTQTKDVTSLSYLKTDGVCTLNGLSGGGVGQILIIINPTANALTLKHNGTGSQKFYISGAADLVLSAQYNAVTLLCDGSNWFVIGKGF